jgi:N-acyl-D-aspartate/D-glutamate deacylase
MRALLAERGFPDLAWATVASYRPDPSLNGKTMAEVATKIAGSDSADAQLEAARILMMNGGASMVYHFMDEQDVARIMKHPMVSIAADASISDASSGVPHPRGYGNTVRVLGEYVRERHVLTLEDAVRKMTSLPASFFGFEGRGVIREGGVRRSRPLRSRHRLPMPRPMQHRRRIPQGCRTCSSMACSWSRTARRPARGRVSYCCGTAAWDAST